MEKIKINYNDIFTGVFALIILSIFGVIAVFISQNAFSPHAPQTNECTNFNTLVQPSRYLVNMTNGTMSVFLDGDFNNSNILVARASYTGSMRPAIPDGAYIFLIPFVQNETLIGDVILYNCSTSPKGSLFHRVINISTINNNTVWFTRGDNNQQDDFSAFGCSANSSEISYKMIGEAW